MSLTVKRTHSKQDAEVKSIIEEIAGDMKSEFGIDYKWKGNSLEFSRTGISGNIKSHPGEVEVNIRKSFFIPLSDAFLRSKVEEYMDKHLQ